MSKRAIHIFSLLSILIAACFILPASLDAQTKKEKKQAEQYQKEGDKLFREKNFRGAIDQYARSIMLVPKNAHTHFWKGAAHFYLNENDLALPELNQALDQGYNRPLDVYLIRWRLNYAKKNFDAALEDIRKGIALDPNNLDFLIALGDISYSKNNYKDALDAYQKAVLRSPENADLYLNIAKIHFSLGDTVAQASSAEEAVNKRTRFLGEAYVLIGDAYEKQRKYPQAADAYQRALAAKPDSYDIYRNLAEVYRSMNRFNDAIDISRRAINVFPNDGPIYTDLAWYYSLADRHEEAIQAAQAGIKLQPNEYMAYTNLCRAYNDTRKPELAISACNNALKLKPEDGETYFYLGRANDLLNRTAEATRYYKRAVTGLLDYAQSRPNYSDAYYLLGNAYFADSQREKAIEAYSKCLELSPGFVKARYNVGIIQVLQRNKNAAMDQYNELLKLDTSLASKLKVEIDKL